LERFKRIAALPAPGKRVTLRQIALELEISVRTVSRDLQFMRDRLLLPIESDRRGHYLPTEALKGRCIFCGGNHKPRT
jgi:predicted DNA-binding transcriptional regulator YafY